MKKKAYKLKRDLPLFPKGTIVKMGDSMSDWYFYDVQWHEMNDNIAAALEEAWIWERSKWFEEVVIDQDTEECSSQLPEIEELDLRTMAIAENIEHPSGRWSVEKMENKINEIIRYLNSLKEKC